MASKTNTSRRGSRKGAKGRNGAFLEIANGCFAGLIMKLDKKKTMLGRDVDCDICLDQNLVSNEHALIIKSGPAFWIEDLNSKHGTFINGREIHRTRLKNRDRITMGDFELVFHGR